LIFLFVTLLKFSAMTLEEYYYKRSHINETHPYPEGLGLREEIAYHRKIIVSWQAELSPEDYQTVHEDEIFWQEKVDSCVCPVVVDD